MGLFTFGKNKMRCPQCGSFDQHTKVLKTASDVRSDDMMRDIMGSLPKDSLLRKASENENNYTCLKCTHIFSEHVAKIWKEIADKHGEALAIKEYTD